jgi:hypothetical protein
MTCSKTFLQASQRTGRERRQPPAGGHQGAKWHLWHGSSYHSIERLESLTWDVAVMKAGQVHALSELQGPTFSFFWALRRERPCPSYTRRFSSSTKILLPDILLLFDPRSDKDGFADGLSLRGSVLGQLIERGVRFADEFNVIETHLSSIPHRYIIVQLVAKAGDIWR